MNIIFDGTLQVAIVRNRCMGHKRAERKVAKLNGKWNLGVVVLQGLYIMKLTGTDNLLFDNLKQTS